MTPLELLKAILQAPWTCSTTAALAPTSRPALNPCPGGRQGQRCLPRQWQRPALQGVAEGGNLGCTQNGRIEYAQKGGLIYTDAIDNSAGVDCSDHEVNIKILLGSVSRPVT
jgi:glutamate dehydrogenase